MYVAWFCYVFENFERIRRPRYAIEELILEFKGQSVLDTPQCSLPQIYAGAGGWDLTGEELVRQKKLLQAHYDIALALLDAWMFTHQDH